MAENDIFDPIFGEVGQQSVLKMKKRANNHSDLACSVHFDRYRASQTVGSSREPVIPDYIVCDYIIIHDDA